MSETEETMKAIQEGSKAANNLMNKIASVTGFFFDVRKHAHDAQKSIIDEIAQREDINPIERAAIIANYKKAIKYYKNSNNIFEKAIKDLEPNAKVEGVCDDWIEFFFNNAEKISNEGIQIVWAKILAKEANEPGTVSTSLLHTLSIMDVEIAKAFNNICRCCIKSYGKKFPFIIEKNDSNKILVKNGITQSLINELNRLGLIEYYPMGCTFKGYEIMLECKRAFYHIRRIVSGEFILHENAIYTGSVKFTRDGEVLCNLLEIEESDDIPDLINCAYKSIKYDKYEIMIKTK